MATNETGNTVQSLVSKTPNVTQELTFSEATVKRLTANDFDLDSKEMITLKYSDCMLVLFYVQNTESSELVTIWATVAQQVAGPIFGAINMLSERKVAEAFTRVKSDGSNPLHWASLKQYPFILVYRNRWPVAVYNGKRNVESIIDYSLTLACQAGYYEPTQVGGGMQVNPENNITMGSYQSFQLNTPGNNSTQFDKDIRGFNPSGPVINEPVGQQTPSPQTSPEIAPPPPAQISEGGGEALPV